MKSSLKPGEKIEAPVELRDLLPTFLALNGCRIPEEIDGLSLLPLLEKGKAPWREYIDIEHSTLIGRIIIGVRLNGWENKVYLVFPYR